MDQDGLNWRALDGSDMDAIASLVDLCYRTDAGYVHGLTTFDDDVTAFITEMYLPTAAGVSTGAFDTQGRLVAFVSVNLEHTAEEYRASIVGHVHPDFRRQGIGSYLLTWSVEEARTLLRTCPTDLPHVLQVSTESLTEGDTRLYEQRGFEQRFAEDIMRRDLKAPITEARFPEGVRLKTWSPSMAGRFYAAYRASYRTRPGFLAPSREEWTTWMDTDGEGFRPQHSLIAFVDDRPIGFICCDDEWVIQIGVVPDWRRRGIGSTLMNEALIRFRAAGTDFVMLHVHVNNAEARAMYHRCGFERVGRRARFLRDLKR